jgi:uncharacterized cupredoxin-like copper-binding protein
MKSIAIAAIAALLAAAATPALAHGMTEPGMKHRGAPEAVEDTPFGQAGDPARISRTIVVSMSDRMRYEPAEIHVKTGETVRLVAANHGAVLHEMVLGTMDELKEHAALMKKFPNMVHDEPNMAHVKPGGKEDIVWKFTKPGDFYFACLQPGHFEAGMVGKVIVGR